MGAESATRMRTTSFGLTAIRLRLLRNPWRAGSQYCPMKRVQGELSLVRHRAIHRRGIPRDSGMETGRGLDAGRREAAISEPGEPLPVARVRNWARHYLSL